MMETMNKGMLVSGSHPNTGMPILSCITKRRFNILDNGRVEPGSDFSSLIDELSFYDDDEYGALKEDLDIYPFKLLTDVVVKGHVIFNPGQLAKKISVTANQVENHLIVFGDRHAFVNQHGYVQISQPSYVPRVELTYKNAYGGKDQVEFEKFYKEQEDKLKSVVGDEINFEHSSPYSYPRNPFGKGYIVGKEFKDKVALPNFEDHRHKLTEQNIVVGHVDHWTKMPVPRCTDWLSHDVFPRLMYFGLRHFMLESLDSVEEIRRQWVPEFLLDTKIDEDQKNFFLANHAPQGASLGMQFPYLQPSQPIKLTGLFTQAEDFILTIPRGKPLMSIDNREGGLTEAQPYIGSVVIDVDQSVMDIVWIGSIAARRPYMPEELEIMPYEVKWSNY